MERSSHVAVCLGYGGDNPKLLVTGGVDANGVALSDVWILDLDSGKWREVRECDLLSDKLNTSPELCHNDESIPNMLHQKIDMCPYFAVADIPTQLSCPVQILCTGVYLNTCMMCRSKFQVSSQDITIVLLPLLSVQE